MKKCWQLFWEMFKIAFCVVGGGFAILAVADEVFAKKFKWTKEGEIVEHLPIFQMVPGIIAGNTAIYIGRKMAGIPGALSALIGVFLPSVIVFSCVAAGYDSIPLGNRFLAAAFLGLRASLTGVIAAMIIRGWKKSVSGFYGYSVMILATFALAVLNVNPALVIVVAIVCGVVTKFCPGCGGEGAPAPMGSAPTGCGGEGAPAPNTAALTGGGGALAPASAGKQGKTFRSAFWAIPLIFLKYGLIAFGGGYVLVPVYLDDFVGAAAPYLQLSPHAFADVMALTQMTPGPIAVNCATYFGYQMAGLSGAFLATFCLLVPGSILLYLALSSLEKFKTSRLVRGILFGVKPVTIAMMLNALWAFASISIWEAVASPATADAAASTEIAWHPLAAALVVFTFVMMLKKKLGVVKLIFLCAAVSVAVELAMW